MTLEVAVVAVAALAVGLVLGALRDTLADWWYELVEVAGAWLRLLFLAAGVVGILYVALRYGLPYVR